MARTNLHITDRVDFQCRNDTVLVRIIDKGELRGIAIPEISIEGKEFHVIAKGPKVEGLEVGDKVLMTGVKNATYFVLPFARDLILVRQDDVVLVLKDKFLLDS